MSDFDENSKATVTKIWTNVVIEGMPAKVSFVRGIGKVLIDGFDIPVPGRLYDADSVVRAYKEQQRLLSDLLSNSQCGKLLMSWESSEGADLAADFNFPDETEPPDRDLPECFVPIIDDDRE